MMMVSDGFILLFVCNFVPIYFAAIRDYQAALEIEEGMQRAREGLERAKKLQKQSERRDYYKILGVGRHASKKEVIKAYRYKIINSKSMFL